MSNVTGAQRLLRHKIERLEGEIAQLTQQRDDQQAQLAVTERELYRKDQELQRARDEAERAQQQRTTAARLVAQDVVNHEDNVLARSSAQRQVNERRATKTVQYAHIPVLGEIEFATFEFDATVSSDRNRRGAFPHLSEGGGGGGGGGVRNEKHMQLHPLRSQDLYSTKDLDSEVVFLAFRGGDGRSGELFNSRASKLLERSLSPQAQGVRVYGDAVVYIYNEHARTMTDLTPRMYMLLFGCTVFIKPTKKQSQVVPEVITNENDVLVYSGTKFYEYSSDEYRWDQEQWLLSNRHGAPLPYRIVHDARPPARPSGEKLERRTSTPSSFKYSFVIPLDFDNYQEPIEPATSTN